MGNIAYNWASWYLSVAKGVGVEIHVRGGEESTDLKAPEQVEMTAQVLRDVSRALGRIKRKYSTSLPAIQDTGKK